jgi:hypothetical protein
MFGDSTSDGEIGNDTDALKENWKREQDSFSELKLLMNDEPELFYQRIFEKLFIKDIEIVSKMS